MKFIRKNREPDSLSDWIQRNPDKKYDKLPSQVAQEIRMACAIEQYFLCAYCCKKISGTNKDTDNEHVVPQKKDDTRTLDFSNIIASCMTKKQCNKAKKDNLIPITPLQPECETQFQFNLDGSVKGLNKRARTTISTLNLNNNALKDARRQMILTFFDEDKDDKFLLQLCSKILEPNNGKLPEYAPAIVNAIKNWINSYMKTLTLNFICETLNLPKPQTNQPINRIITDSRQAQSGDLFVALIGENHDAHDFVADVLAKGALALVSRDDFVGVSGCLKVDDTLIALQNLAKAWRQVINPFVFGITGSSGKTTVKEMLATVLREKFGADAVLATAGNFNNHIGLPLTLLNLRENHRYAVIEMGMNHFGELAVLTQIAQPNVALVNNAMRAHIGCGFNGVDDIARAKSEIYQGIQQDGLAILPIDDANLPIFQAACKNLNLQTQTFGFEQGYIHAENLVLQPLASEFDLVQGSERVHITLPVAGRHNVSNACAAAALALAGGVKLTEIARGWANFANIKGRLQVKHGIKNSTILDDTYNANPDSMKAALDVLAKMPAPRVFVMGDMGELGENEAPKMHEEIGIYAKNLGIELAYFVGENSVQAAEKFGADGLWFVDKDPLILSLVHDLPENASVLVKGSRFMKMEEVVMALMPQE